MSKIYVCSEPHLSKLANGTFYAGYKLDDEQARSLNLAFTWDSTGDVVEGDSGLFWSRYFRGDKKVDRAFASALTRVLEDLGRPTNFTIHGDYTNAPSITLEIT